MGVHLPTALIPVRAGPDAKRRLAHVLDAASRTDLVRRLFDHVAGVLSDTGLRVIALSPYPLDTYVEVWTDERPGLNAAVHAALEKCGAPILVVHADLPQLSVADVDALLYNDADVVIARAHDGGTNGLLLRRLIEPAFGPASALAHARRGRDAGLTTRVVDIPGFMRDVDDESSLTLVRSNTPL